MESIQSFLLPLAAIVLAYLVGSLSFAVIVSRLMGLSDPRSYGSGNPGATNVLRSGNKLAALLTLAFDALKGAVPVLLAMAWRERLGLGELGIGMVGLSAFLGHLWPVFFRFQGGKGVATAAGALLALNPWLGLATLGTWLLVALAFRFASLASIAAAAVAPFYQLLIWEPTPMALPLVLMCLLLIWRHGPNIRKLMAGTESRIGQKAAPSAAAAEQAHGHPHAHTPHPQPHAHEAPHRDHPHRRHRKGQSKPH